LALDVDEIVDHDNCEIFDDVELDNNVDIEFCDGEKRLPLICSLSLCLLFAGAAFCCFLLA
jgi:hypothetical protein